MENRKKQTKQNTKVVGDGEKLTPATDDPTRCRRAPLRSRTTGCRRCTRTRRRRASTTCSARRRAPPSRVSTWPSASPIRRGRRTRRRRPRPSPPRTPVRPSCAPRCPRASLKNEHLFLTNESRIMGFFFHCRLKAFRPTL